MGKKGKKGRKKDADQQTISLKEGWETIYGTGVKPFFERVEDIDPKKLAMTSVPKEQFITTYDTIFTMCIQREPYNYSSELYSKHTEALQAHFKERFLPTLQGAKEAHGLEFLKEWVARWRIGKWCVDGMQRMFMYLDRFHVPNSEDLLNSSEQGYTLFRNLVFERYKEVARDAILEFVRRERDGEALDRDLLRDSINVFVELGQKLKKVELQIYKEEFHKELVSQTRQYYKVKARQWLDQFSCPEYLVQAETCVDSERDRLQSYIHKSSNEGLMQATRDEVLKEHQSELLAKETGISQMLERTSGADPSGAKEDLSRLYRLYEAVPDGLNVVSLAMRSYICKLGLGHIDASKKGDKEHALIRNLIGLHDRFLNIVKENFRGDQLFHKALKDAFEEFINKQNYVSHFLAQFAHTILKKGCKLQIGEMETTMDHVVMIYGYIRDKDIFESHYQQCLASRLLQDQSQSEQSERAMIGKLKTTSGYHWTSKLEDMFKDIQRSKELMVEFNSQFGGEFDVELNVSVCTTGAWPSSSLKPVQKPVEIGPVADRFQQFYVDKFSGRRVQFRWDKGQAEIVTAFNPKSTKILVVTTYQMLIMLMFNRNKTLSFDQIAEETQIPPHDLKDHLMSMAHPKVKVLRKNPNSKELEGSHKFQINPKYSNPRAKVNVPLFKTKEKPIDTVPEAVLVLRKHLMDAAIVRIMKARKTLGHHDLVAEVVKQLQRRFKPTPIQIKKRIANLIELEYLKRDENDRQTYHYLQ